MKTKQKWLLTLALAVVLGLSLFGGIFAYAEADYPERQIYDIFNKLPFEQDESLENQAHSLFGKVPMYVVIVEGEDNPDYMERYGLTQEDDFVLLMVHTNGYGWYYDMHIYGKFCKNISDEEMNRVLDHPDVYDNIKNGYLYQGISAWMNQTARVAGANFAKRVLISLAIGCVAALISCLVIVIVYHTKQKSTSYPLNKFASLSPDHASDRFITKTVTSHTVSSNSGSKGGSRGGGGGGRHGGR